MNREQTSALAALIARGAGHALDVGRPGDDYEGISEAALTYARTCAWRSPEETAGLQQLAHEHVTCRVQLDRALKRVSALEVALAGILGAANHEGISFRQSNLDTAIDNATTVLLHDPEVA